MLQHQYKRIGNRPAVKPVSKLDVLKDTWIVMKPFVKFSFRAMRVIAHALIFIVKNIPKAQEQKEVSKSNSIIKVR